MSNHRWGLTIPISDEPLHRQVDFFAEAERLGYTDLWSSEVNANDGFTPLAAAAMATENARVGTAIVNAFTRGPTTLAMQAGSVAELAPGRFILGIGAAAGPVVEWWNGIPFERPLSRVRDTVTVVRQLLDGEKVTADLDTMSIRSARYIRPVEQRIPIYIAALRPKMLRLAGQIADGVIINLLSPEDVPRVVDIVRESAKEAGRDPDSVEIVCRIFLCASEDREGALEVAKRFLAGYLTVPTYKKYQQWLGRGEKLQPVWDAWDAGDRRGALEALPIEVVDELVPNGHPDKCKEMVRRYQEAGVDMPMLQLFRPESDPVDNSYALRAMAPD